MKKPLIMGILNVTPDSFSDGGLYLDREAALKQAEALITEGADILDIGGESTRPGAAPVSLQMELDRTIPIVEKVAARFPVQISIDTYKPEVAEAAIKVGACIINDITAAADIRMGQLVAKNGVTILLTHMKGTPRSMQDNPLYPDGVVLEVQRFFRKRVRVLMEMGIARSSIWIDPGIGFGKTVNHNLDLLRHLDLFQELGGELAIGTSRKSFLSHLLGSEKLSFEERAAGTLTTGLWAYSKGASIFRVHDVANMKRSFLTWDAIRYGIS